MEHGPASCDHQEDGERTPDKQGGGGGRMHAEDPRTQDHGAKQADSLHDAERAGGTLKGKAALPSFGAEPDGGSGGTRLGLQLAGVA